ncbi:MAG: GxxExxY protein [Geobacteraceae bacterium]|nr:GxxExxY protein [Geobacteraceae bacterium]NTW79517.1 GxxExxY protein [Geobacteraceae bacterium]
MDINGVTDKIIGAAITVHKELGPGLLESVYQNCLYVELEYLKVRVQKEVMVPVMYRGCEVTDKGFRLDLLIEDLVIVELKSVENVQPVHSKQLLTYLRLANKPLGLLINFNVPMLKDGITRISNGYGL